MQSNSSFQRIKKVISSVGQKTRLSESMKRIKKEISKIGGFVYKHSDSLEHMLKGQITIKAFENNRLVYSFEDHNVIVNSASVLISRLLKNSQEPKGGITYLALGEGASGWNLQSPPEATSSQAKLASETLRVPVTSSTFIDPTTGEEVSSYTNIVDYHFFFSESSGEGAFVELGLFGGDATSANETGTMVNYRTFPVLNKTASMSFVIIVRITA